MEIIPTTSAIVLVAALIGVIGAFQVQRYLGRREAAVAFRATIDPTVFSSFNGRLMLSGHVLHAALIEVFPAHLAAAHEFRRYLGPVDRWRFRKAWHAYHGGSEEYPDWFKRYCLPDNGPQLLVQRLEALRNAASQI